MGRLLRHFALLAAVASVALGESPDPLQSCAMATGALPGFGAAYRGVFENDDYKLRAVIPKGFTAWGAAPVAPFHGFAIFLNASRSACIVLEIHRRVDLGEGLPNSRGPNAQIGNVKGNKDESTGSLAGLTLRNVWIAFSARHNPEVFDGYVLFVTPISDGKKYEPLFEKFVSQMRFPMR
jgi:hypothetical protein